MKIFLTGASSGIGRATAEALTRAGHEVWGTSRDASRVPDLPRMRAVRLDLADRVSIHDAFRHAAAEAGAFDVVINNAGSGHFGPAELLTAEMSQEQFQTLVLAQIQLCQLALPAMRARNDGLIINITSLAARLPVPFMAAYNAAKAAMASFTLSLQLELGDTRIRIVDLQPADISTGFNDAVRKTDDSDTPVPPRVSRTWNVVDRNMKEAPKPDLVARRILELVVDENPPPRVTVGGAFQANVAPLIDTFLPQRVRLWGLKKYYGI
jgi:NAD(P)-dependent dehydrogenase (short-subunit alcohol dehydrogenase family)